MPPCRSPDRRWVPGTRAAGRGRGGGRRLDVVLAARPAGARRSAGRAAGRARGRARDRSRASVDPHGAPLHALTSRLEAPDAAGRPRSSGAGAEAARPAGTRSRRGRTAAGSCRRPSSSRGQDPLHASRTSSRSRRAPPPPPGAGPALPELLRVRGRDPSARAAHPAGLRRSGPAVGAVGPGRAARTGPHVADLVVAAALDCPSAWATVGRRASRLRGGAARVAAPAGRGPVEVLDPVRVTARWMRWTVASCAPAAPSSTPTVVLAVLDALHVAVRSLPATM
jgi:hypothetical protein